LRQNLARTKSSTQVEAKAVEPNKEIVTVSTGWSIDSAEYSAGEDSPEQAIFTKVSAGTKPIVNATVKVNVTRPGQDMPYELPLNDNGVGNSINIIGAIVDSPSFPHAGADKVKGDGIYSATFVAYTEPGRYSIQVRIPIKCKSPTLCDQLMHALYRHKSQAPKTREKILIASLE
jgi:hypothetical protein